MSYGSHQFLLLLLHLLLIAAFESLEIDQQLLHFLAIRSANSIGPFGGISLENTILTIQFTNGLCIVDLQGTVKLGHLRHSLFIVRH